MRPDRRRKVILQLLYNTIIFLFVSALKKKQHGKKPKNKTTHLKKKIKTDKPAEKKNDYKLTGTDKIKVKTKSNAIIKRLSRGTTTY